jgi:bacteriocin biosynthesis cyclodehydratase domain-containing protein
VRPVLKPALRRLWRDDHTLQLGVAPPHAVVLAGLDERAIRWVDRLDGSCDRLAWIAGAMADGLTRTQAEHLLTLLEDAGALQDAAAPAGALESLPAEERDRLAPDLAALALLHGEPGEVLARRQAALVEVRGLGRVGSGLTALLAAAGVGHLLPVDPEPTRAGDSTPGGLLARDPGLGRERATRRAVQRTAPRARTDATDRTPDAVVLAGPEQGSADAAELLRDGVPHLLVAVSETTGIVGPLVLPGTSACLRCLDLHRTDRDPAWPRLRAQLAVPAPTAAADVVLTSTVVATAAQQLLGWIDSAGQSPAACVNGTLELASPGWRFRRRSWSPHPACGCGWRQWAGGDTMTG